MNVTQRELREKSKAKELVRETERDGATLDCLRRKFLQTALSYCGVPYARRYHEPDCKSPEERNGIIICLYLQLPPTTPLSSSTAVDWSGECCEI